MSVVATKVTEKEIIIATDSFRSRGRSGQDKDKQAKLYQSDQELIVGTVGHSEEFGLMKIFLEDHRPKAATEDAFIDFMAEFHDWLRKKTGNNSYALYNDYHFIYRGCAFMVSEGYYVRAITDYD